MTIKRRDLLLRGGALLGGAAFGLFAPRGAARAHEYDLGKLTIEHPWLRAPKEGETTAPFFVVIQNKGATPDKLVALKSEKFGKFEIHGDPKNPAAAAPLTLPPNSKTTLAPGGAHAMLQDIKKHLEVGWGLEMTLVFEKAGEVTIDASIDAPDAMHAHDAEAMERWQKAQGGDAPAPKPMDHGAHQHHQHMQHDQPPPHGDHMQHGGGAKPPAESR